jgi:hypothetical protein
VGLVAHLSDSVPVVVNCSGQESVVTVSISSNLGLCRQEGMLTVCHGEAGWWHPGAREFLVTLTNMEEIS